jgi:hypothetical protein
MSQTETTKQMLIEKIKSLPAGKLNDVLKFVDAIKTRKTKDDDPVLRVAGCLSGTPQSAAEIEEELYGRSG